MSTRVHDLIGKRVPSHLGVQLSDSGTPQPSSTHSCECSRAPRKPLPFCPDGEPMTANYLGIMEIVSEFPHAIPRQAN